MSSFVACSGFSVKVLVNGANHNFCCWSWSFCSYCCWRLCRAQTLLTLFFTLKTDIDDCASHPCKYKGTCTDRQNGFRCSCAPGFSGPQCEIGNRNR